MSSQNIVHVGKGTSFLKSEAGKVNSDDESTSVPIQIIGQVEASNENVKSILKPVTPTRGSAINNNNNISNSSQGNLRAAMIARDEKRIQFNIKEDSKNIVITTDDDDEETSSAAIDEIKPKKDFMGKIFFHFLFV